MLIIKGNSCCLFYETHSGVNKTKLVDGVERIFIFVEPSLSLVGYIDKSKEPAYKCFYDVSRLEFNPYTGDAFIYISCKK